MAWIICLVTFNESNLINEQLRRENVILRLLYGTNVLPIINIGGTSAENCVLWDLLFVILANY